MVCGLISHRSARDDYGVVISKDHVVDIAATAALRTELASARPALDLIDRGPRLCGVG